MKNKILILLAIAVVGSASFLRVSSASVTNTVSATAVSPAEIAKLMSEFEEWRTNDVVWLGSPITGQSIDGGPAKGLMDQKQRADVQLGLRRDGLVVWRTRK